MSELRDPRSITYFLLSPDIEVQADASALAIAVLDIPELADGISKVKTEFFGVVETPGTLTVEQHRAILRLIDSSPEADLLYADELAVVHGDPMVIAKPVYSPERLRCQFYWGSLVIYRTDLVKRIGGMRTEFKGAAHYDLALRAAREARSVLHSPEVLYNATRAPTFGALKPGDEEYVEAVLVDHLRATGGGEVRSVGIDGVHDTRRLVVGAPLVSIVIPSRGLWSESDSGRSSFLIEAVRSVIDLSTYSNFEIVVVFDSVASPELLDELSDIGRERIVFVEWTQPFNFSGKINLGVVHSRGEFVLILNDDVKLLTPDWIESLLSLAQRPGAGMSGCMLYFEDDTIQHAGHGYWRGDATHIGMFMPRGSGGAWEGYRVEREVHGVTAACAMMPRTVYDEVGGMTELLPGNFNDVDLCMKVTAAGHEIYWTPHAELYHFESKTRNPSVRKYEVDTAWGRWAHRMHDPRYWPYPA